MGVFSRVLLVGSAGLALAALVDRARIYWPFTVDDTFITLRYSKHLAEGLGVSWNPRGEPVEGYTTAAWMALLAVPHALGLDGLAFAKAAGVVLAFGAMVAASALAYELTRGLDVRARRLAALAPFPLAVAWWPLALHAISGMETTLAALLVTLFVLVSVRFLRNPTALRGRSLGTLALLAALTRPEAALSCGVTLVAQLVMTPRPGRRVLVRAVALFLLAPGALYFVIRYAHFGLLLPLSFYVKAQGQVDFAGLGEVTAFFLPFAWPRPAIALLGLVGVIVAGRVLVPALLGLAAFTAFFVFPAHIMGFEARYLAPLFPSVAALVATGLGRAAAPLYGLVDAQRERTARLSSAGLEVGLAVVAWALLATLVLPGHEPDGRARWLAYGEGLQRAHITLAHELRRLRMAVRSPRIALLDVGAVAYYSEWHTVDTFGLNDKHVALARRKDVRYVFAQNPELLVVVSAEPSRYVEVFDWETPLYQGALARGFGELCTYRFLDDYHLLVLARPGSTLREAMHCERPQPPKAVADEQVQAQMGSSAY